MKKMTLGEKIRARRKELSMTQEALGGDVVTRIMISRLEHNELNPSLHTLLYLADRLSLPAGYLLSEDDDLFSFLRPAIIAEIRAAFREQKWDKVLLLCEKYGIDEESADDECALILCECAVRLGCLCYEAGDTANASSYFDSALLFSQRTVYHTEALIGEALLSRAMLAYLRGDTPFPYLDAYAEALGGATHVDRYLLLRFFSDMEAGKKEHAAHIASMISRDETLCVALISVWRDEAEGEIKRASASLAAILEGDSADILKRDPYLYYRCVAKMEALSAALGDYKTAYLYAAAKSRLEKQYHITK